MIDIGWLIEQGPCRKYTAGKNVPCPGGPEPSQRAMYVLLAGRVDVYKKSAAGGTQMFATIQKGDVFGGREYFTDADDCTYVAGADSVVYVITEDSFNDLSWSRPEILFDILRAAYTPEDIRKKAQEAVKAGAEESVQTKAAAHAVANLFPEGHKHYPDITHPEYTKLVFPKDYKCPFCKKEFKDFRVFRSKLYETGPTRYDLRKYYTDFQTEWYDIVTCKNCLFSTFHNYFTDPKPMQKAKIDKLLSEARAQVHLDFGAERCIDYVFTTHYLALLCADGYPSVGKQIRAKIWGNISWLYEDVEDEEMVKFAAKKAAEAYEQVYTESRLTPVQEQITCLSIAGMQHRAGIDNNLRKFLFKAKTLSAGDKTFAKLAEEFMYEMKIND